MSHKRQHRPSPPRRLQSLDIQSAQAMAMTLHRNGELENAETLYRRILEVQPAYPDALHYLGVLLHQRGDSAEAAHLIEQSIVEQPDYADAHNSLGNVLKSLGRTDEAIAAYRQAIACRRDFAQAYRNLGMALQVQDDPAAVIAVLQQAIAVDPGNADTYFSLGRVLSAADQPDAAIEAIREGLRLDPRKPEGHRQLGQLFYTLNRTEDAIACYRQWTEQYPDEPAAWHMLAAVTGENVPERAADDYLQTLFDRFAENFDQQLKRLEYQAPELLAAALATQRPIPDSTWHILDAGCGTGLCGPLLRPYAHHLIGVDLSPGMLSKARGRKVYDGLITAELTAFLQSRFDEFDLIISADTLEYFGDLSVVFAAAAGALRPEGRLAFTVERLDDDSASANFRLNPHGRYSHTEQYVRQQLAAAGLKLQSWSTAALRLEMKQPVMGYVVLAQKSTPDAGSGVE